MSYLVANPGDRFSRDEAHILYLQQVLESKNKDLKLQKEKLLNLGIDKIDRKDPGGLVVNMDQAGEEVKKAGIQPAEVDLGEVKFGGRDKEQPVAIDVKYDAKSWGSSYVVLRKEVSIADDMCSWGDAPKAKADVQVYSIVIRINLSFDKARKKYMCVSGFPTLPRFLLWP